MNTTKDLNVFQLVTMSIFLVIGVLGIVIFATSKTTGGAKGYKAVVWGVLSKQTIDASLETYSIQGIDPHFTYTEFPEEGFDQVILQAVAEGRGPDAIVFPDTMYFGQIEKLVTIPNEQITARAFSDTYLDIGNQFSIQGGIKAFPLVVDPLVMFYNKDMFTSAGILTPPQTWKELADITNSIARKRDDGVLDRAFVAFGEYTNINHAKKILYTLLSQAGVRLSFFDTGASMYVSGLTKSDQADIRAGQPSASETTRSVLTYYTDFANPLSSVYTWNRSFSSSRDAFLSQNLAVYFAPGSEVEYILSRNPNLNFAIAPVPQENPDVKSVHGKTYALGFLITSQNLKESYPEVTKFFTADPMIQGLADAMGVAPAKRTLVANSKSAQESKDLSVIYESAKYASTWMDPNEVQSDSILQTLIEAVTSGKQTLSESVQDAGDRLDRLYIRR
jgi:ABC-type glycerol-3-phosphate transport system substrate-binding protein